MKTVNKHRKKWDGVQILATALLLVFAVVILIPFWNAVVISLETARAYSLYPASLVPMEFTLDNYKEMFAKGDALLLAYKGTLTTTVFGTAAGMAVSVLGAYAFSRQFPGKKFLFRVMVFTMFFGGGLVPTYLLYRNLGLLNTYAGVVIVSLVSVYNIIIMKNGFEGTPMELQEAAMIDGANDLVIFGKVMLPLQKPLIATFTLFSLVGYWNSWYWPMLMLKKKKKNVLQLFLRNIVNDTILNDVVGTSMAAQQQRFAQGIKMASVFVVMLPIMLVYPFLQKYFTKGILLGAVKA